MPCICLIMVLRSGFRLLSGRHRRKLSFGKEARFGFRELFTLLTECGFLASREHGFWCKAHCSSSFSTYRRSQMVFPPQSVVAEILLVSNAFSSIILSSNHPYRPMLLPQASWEQQDSKPAVTLRYPVTLCLSEVPWFQGIMMEIKVMAQGGKRAAFLSVPRF